MLHLYYGTDTIKTRTKALATANATELPVERFEAETFIPGSLRESVGAVSLFGDATVFIIDSPSTNEVLWLELVEMIEVVSESSQLCIVIDTSIPAAQLKLLKPHVAVIEESVKDKGAPFNTFALADAFANRDRKALWILYTEAVHYGQSAEELIGILWWQIKSMRLAEVTSTAAEAGMKEYPYNKAKRAVRNFKSGELITLSHQLFKVYHAGHAGEKDILIGLEEWVLGV